VLVAGRHSLPLPGHHALRCWPVPASPAELEPSRRISDFFPAHKTKPEDKNPAHQEAHGEQKSQPK